MSCALVVSESPEANNGWLRSIIIANGTNVVKVLDIMQCFVFCDGEVMCQGSISDAIVIASGRVKAKEVYASVLIESARSSKLVKWFSLEMVGLKLTEEKEGLRVTQVRPKSPADRCGLLIGDLILTRPAPNRLLSLERQVRKAFAEFNEYSLTILRAENQLTATLPLAD